MLGSLQGVSDHDDQEEDKEDPTDSYYQCTTANHQQQKAVPPPPQQHSSITAGLITSSPVTHMRQLLIRCAELVYQSDFQAARRLVTLLSTTCSPYGDSTDRLVHQFSRALSSRINRHSISLFPSSIIPSISYSSHGEHAPSSSSASSLSGACTLDVMPPSACSAVAAASASAADDPQATDIITGSSSSVQLQMADEEVDHQSSYLFLNQITPFLRFSHLTANQAILEAIEGKQSIHILDFDTMHGVQWPPLMQAIAERSDPSNPPRIRITGTGRNLGTLLRTGDRLEKFAKSLGLTFQFHPLLLNDEGLVVSDHDHDSPPYSNMNKPPSSSDLYQHLLQPSALDILPDETLAVNCVLYLHRLLRDDSRNIRLFLSAIKAMKPKVVTVAEREANHNHPIFLRRFIEALDHYTAFFDSLEATLPPNSRERLSVEQVWLGREILDIVGGEGDERRERHEKLENWVEKLNSVGFTNAPLSPFALSQAKLLLRLHYPSEGYQLQILNDSFFLGWQNQALFTVSSWH